MDQVTDWITLGRIGAAHGIKGWVRLVSFTDPQDNLLDYRRFTVRRGQQWQEIEIDQARVQGKILVGHILGCDDRDLASSYTGCELRVPREVLPSLAAGDYYWYQLQGLQVWNQQQEYLGSVARLLETGANDVLVVAATEDSLDDRERLIPYVKDAVIKQVDLEQGRILVDWPADY